ncbi:hypothetical protein ACYF6T_39850 [Streptomyces sp. 7R007]
MDEWDAPGPAPAARRLMEQVDHCKGDHHGVPTSVFSPRPPTAGDRGVMVHGASTARPTLEVRVGWARSRPTRSLFGAGRRQSDILPARLELETFGIDTPEATHIRNRTRR